LLGFAACSFGCGFLFHVVWCVSPPDRTAGWLVLAIKPLALDAPDDDPFGAGVVEDRDAAADFGAVWCGLSSVSTLLHLCASASIICMLMQNSYFSL
jgi:hypothetical protein